MQLKHVRVYVCMWGGKCKLFLAEMEAVSHYLEIYL